MGKEEFKMFGLILGVFYIISFMGFIISLGGFAITSHIKYSATSHLIWGVTFIVFTVCSICAFGYHLGLSFYY